MAYRYVFNTFVLRPFLTAYDLLTENDLPDLQIEIAQLLDSATASMFSETELAYALDMAKQVVTWIDTRRCRQWPPEWYDDYVESIAWRYGKLLAAAQATEESLRHCQEDEKLLMAVESSRHTLQQFTSEENAVIISRNEASPEFWDRVTDGMLEERRRVAKETQSRYVAHLCIDMTAHGHQKN